MTALFTVHTCRNIGRLCRLAPATPLGENQVAPDTRRDAKKKYAIYLEQLVSYVTAVETWGSAGETVSLLQINSDFSLFYIFWLKELYAKFSLLDFCNVQS